MKTFLHKSPAIFLSVLIVVTASSCSNKQKKASRFQQPPVGVTPYIVKEKNVVYYNVFPATVTALEEIDLRSEVSGYLTGIFFKDGSRVEKGQKLYEIDRTKYRAAYDQALAAKNIASANLEKAQRDLKRYQNLASQNAIAEQTLADARTNVENAVTQVKAAEAALQRASSDFDYSVIRAPFSGTIGFSQVKKGAYVLAGQTTLTGLSSINPTGVDISVSSVELPYYRKLERESADLPDSTFLLIMPDGTTYPQPGKIYAIDRAVDPLTSTVKVRFVFPNKNDDLKAGMDARAKVLNSESGQQLVIPTKAVTEQMSEYFVFVIHGHTVKQKRIETGLNLGENQVVLSGLQAGDTIVAEGLKKIRDGSQVTFGKNNKPGNKEMKND